MEPWQYSALQTQFSSLLQLLSDTTQNPRTIPAPENNTRDAMNIDSFEDGALKTGIKRKLSDCDNQNDLPKKISFRHQMEEKAKLSLDIYTQTDASFVAEQNSSLVKITELVMENKTRLDSIQRLLLNIDKKINLFGSESLNIDSDGKKPPLTVEVKPSSSFESIKTPVTPSTPASFNSDVETSDGALEQAVNNKSPLVGVSPSLPSVVPLKGIPVTIQSNSDNGWSHNTLHGIDSSPKLSNQDPRTELQSKASDMNIIDTASNVLVPVIFATENKTKRCTTTEIALQDLLNGNVTNPEDHIQIFRGCWLGDRLDPHSRIWFYGDSKIIQRAEASGSNPAKLSLNLLEALFTREEMAASNVNGARGRDLLDPIKIKAIYAHINYKFPTEPEKQELRWHFLKPRIDSKCRAQRRIQRDHQAVGDIHPSNKERPFRSKLNKPSVDPKIKEELLYGLMKPDAPIGLPLTQISQDINTYAGSGANENSVNIGGNGQTSANQTSLVYGNS